MRTIVIANCNGEDTRWAFDVGGWEINRCIEQRPMGREAFAYLNYIVHWNEHIRGDTIFCQGNPFDHDFGFLGSISNPRLTMYGTQLDCVIGGAYDEKSLVHEYCRIFGLPVQPVYRFVAGAQFRVTGGQIRARPLEFYQALLAATKVDPLSAYTLERLWPTIFGLV